MDGTFSRREWTPSPTRRPQPPCGETVTARLRGVASIDYGQADRKNRASRDLSAEQPAISVPESYRPLDVESLPSYLAGYSALRARLGGDPAAWRVDEVGDGNLNLVFLVRGPCRRAFA